MLITLNVWIVKILYSLTIFFLKFVKAVVFHSCMLFKPVQMLDFSKECGK